MKPCVTVNETLFASHRVYNLSRGVIMLLLKILDDHDWWCVDNLGLTNT